MTDKDNIPVVEAFANYYKDPKDGYPTTELSRDNTAKGIITVTTEDPKTTRMRQGLVPEWMDKILKQAEAQHKIVKVTRNETGTFGTFIEKIELVGGDKPNESEQFVPGITHCCFCHTTMRPSHHGAVRDVNTGRFAHIRCAQGKEGKWSQFSTMANNPFSY